MPQQKEISIKGYSSMANNPSHALTKSMPFSSIGFTFVDFFVYVVNPGPVSTVTLAVEFSGKTKPLSNKDSDWATIQIDAIDEDTGGSIMVDYKPSKMLDGPTTFSIRSRCYGTHMRLRIFSNVDGGSVIATALRIP